MAENDGKIVIGIEGDPSGVNKALADTEKKGKETASNLSAAFGAVAGAIAGAKIFGAFKSALDEANKLEASLNRVESAARSFGQSTAKAKEAAIAMSKDGFLSLNESAQAFSTTMALGLNLDQSKKFIDAAKDVASFGNTIGNASESVVSGLKGILTGSSELTENMSPKMKSLSMAFTVNKTKLGEAKAMNILYNETLKLQNSYLGDSQRYLDTAAAAQKRFTAATDSASAAIGKALQPAIKSLFNTLTGIVEGVTKFFTSLDGATQLVLVAGVAVASLSGVLVALLPVLRAISLSNPFGWVTLAIVGFTALTAAVVEFQNKSKPENIVKSYREAAKEIDNLGKRAQELSVINKRTIQEEQELAATKEALRKKAQELGLDYDKLAQSAGGYLAVTKAIKDAEFTEKAADLTEQRMKLMAENQFYLKRQQRMVGNADAIAYDQRLIDANNAEIARLNRLQDTMRDGETEMPSGRAASLSGGGKPASEVRFIESQKRLAEIERNKQYTIGINAGNPQAIADAKENARQLAEAEIDQLKSVYAEYIEDKAQMDRIALQNQTDNAIKAIREQVNAGRMMEADAAENIEKIRETQIKRETQLRLESFAMTAQAANATTSGFSQMMRSKNIGQSLSGQGSFMTGLSQFSPALSALGPIGSMFGAAGGIVGTLTDLFGKSEEERKREAEAAEKQRQEQIAILELQAGYQKAQLAIAEANAKLPFENLQRQLRLADIQSQSSILSGTSESAANATRLATRQAAMQSVLTEQSGAISGGSLFGGTGSTAPELIGFLNQRGAESVQVSQFLELANGLSNNTNPDLMRNIISRMQGYAGAIPDTLYGSVMQSANRSLYNADISRQYDTAYNSMSPLAQLGSDFDQKAYEYQQTSLYWGGTASETANRLASEFRSDVGIAENLLSVLEQSQATQLEIAGSTKKTADNTGRLTQMREASILDLAGGGIRGFGSFFRTTAGNAFNSIDGLINPSMPAMQTPSAISNSLSIATLTRGWQDRTADGIESLVRIQTEALQLLAEIALNSNRAGDVGGSLSEAELLNIMSKVRSRLV